MLIKIKRLLLSLIVLFPLLYMVMLIVSIYIVDNICDSRFGVCSDAVYYVSVIVAFAIAVLLPYWKKSKESSEKHLLLTGILEVIMAPVVFIFISIFFGGAFGTVQNPSKFFPIAILAFSIPIGLLILVSGIDKIRGYYKSKN